MDGPRRMVVNNYPVERLPDDLRLGFETGRGVVVTVEAEPALSVRTISEILDSLEHKRTLSDDPVERVRALRAGNTSRFSLIRR